MRERKYPPRSETFTMSYDHSYNVDGQDVEITLDVTFNMVRVTDETHHPDYYVEIVDVVDPEGRLSDDELESFWTDLECSDNFDYEARQSAGEATAPENFI